MALTPQGEAMGIQSPFSPYSMYGFYTKSVISNITLSVNSVSCSEELMNLRGSWKPQNL